RAAPGSWRAGGGRPTPFATPPPSLAAPLRVHDRSAARVCAFVARWGGGGATRRLGWGGRSTTPWTAPPAGSPAAGSIAVRIVREWCRERSRRSKTMTRHALWRGRRARWRRRQLNPALNDVPDLFAITRPRPGLETAH